MAITMKIPAETTPDFQERCLHYTPFSIDISSLADFYDTLSADEKEEQLRDWGFFGLLASLGIKPPEIDTLTGMDFPMRYTTLKEKYKFPVLP